MIDSYRKEEKSDSQFNQGVRKAREDIFREILPRIILTSDNSLSEKQVITNELIEQLMRDL